MAGKVKFYVVWKGRRTGVFTSWAQCEAQVKGFTGAEYKAFASREAAERAFAAGYRAHVGKAASSGDWLFAPHPPLIDSICVDAACSGSPGRLEWRGVQTGSEKEIFHQGPFENGTNNIGEFLAIVDGLAWLVQNRLNQPVYSDSGTAIAWVKAKKCNTELFADETNALLFELIDRAEDWLEDHKLANPILKWDTKAWGEIPADFNRK
jgi:ribonuclease HI